MHTSLRPVVAATVTSVAATAVLAVVVDAAPAPASSGSSMLLAGLLPEGTVSTSLIADGIGPLADGWPDEPLWICAVRQRDGRRVVFGHTGATPPLADAVSASCAILGFFQPVTIDGTGYIDGGVHSPTNADVLRDMTDHLDLVLVSSPMSLASRRLGLAADRPVRRWSGALLDAEALVLRRRGVHVLAFQPTAGDTDVMEFNAMEPTRRAAVADAIRSSTLRRLERSDTQARLAPLLG